MVYLNLKNIHNSHGRVTWYKKKAIRLYTERRENQANYYYEIWVINILTGSI